MTGVSQILQQLAANAAATQLARGNRYADLIQGISNVPAQILNDQERQQQIDLQRAGEAQRLAIANRADQRAQADQAYQDTTRALEVDKQIKTRAILQAYTGGTPNDPSSNNLDAGIAKAKDVGLPEMIPSLWELHQKEQQFKNPRPYETDPTKDQRDPNTNAILTPGQPKMPEMGTPAYAIATQIRDLEGPGAPAPRAPSAPPAPGVSILPPPPLVLPPAPGGPGAPATTAAPPIAPPAPTDYGYGNRYGTTTPKGLGHLGPLQRPDGSGVMSEYSIGVMIDGKETEIPSIVPTLTKDELNGILTAPPGTPPPVTVQQKAVDYAKGRIAEGKDPFAGPGEQQNLYPDLPRAAIPTPAGAPPAIGPAPSSAPGPVPGTPAQSPTPGTAPPRLTHAQAVAKAYADAEAAKDPHSAIFKEWKDYTAQGGTLGFDAYMTADANRKKPVVSLSGMNALYGQTDPKGLAQAIQSGSMPPDISQYGRPVQGAIASELAKNGFDLSRAQTDWKATQKHIATLNGAQQLRLNQAISALPDMLDSVDALAAQWKGGAFPLLNKANLVAAKQGAYGKDVASVATQLDAQIADVTADLGNVYMGGNSPTDHALGLAGKSLNGEWDQKVLHDMVQLAKKNVTIRQNSIKNTGVAGASADNPYAPPSVAPKGDPLGLFGPKK